MGLVKTDVMEATGPAQLCGGQPAGCEASVHALCSLFDNPASEGVYLVDAKNAFNQLNCQSILQNMQVIFPSLAPILINCYFNPAALFIPTSETIWSKKETTQGDPLGMAMYAIGVTPLIQNYKRELPTSLKCGLQMTLLLPPVLAIFKSGETLLLA